jgi:integrase
MGELRRRGNVWWLRYYRNGERHEESSHSRKKQVAIDLLKIREGDVAKGVPVSAKAGRFTFNEAARDLLNDYTTNDKDSFDEVRRRVEKHLLPFFGGRRLVSITTIDVRAYIAYRKAETTVVRREHTRTVNGKIIHIREQRRETAGPSNGEINRELQHLKRMFSLAMQADRIFRKPHIPMLDESTPRKGFFEREQFESVRRHLPESLQPLVTFAYVTGWRVPSEVQTLQWSQVDFSADTVRLEPGMTKNGEARVFPFTAELRAVLEAQRAAHDNLKAAGIICPWIFFRLIAKGRGGTKYPKPITAFTKAWKAACVAAGCPGRIPHDFRRTAVRNLVRAGVPEKTAMKLTGHLTRSVFDRYNIVSEGDLFTAAAQLDAFHTRQGQFGDNSGTGTASGGESRRKG